MSRNILMLEHDEDDRYITQAIFNEHNYDIKINFVGNSDEVLAHLDHCTKTNSRYPSMILLNYNSGPANALSVLRELRSNPHYMHIPVVVLSGSAHNDIIKECYSSGASSFIQKPSRDKETQEKIVNFFNYWFDTVELP